MQLQIKTVQVITFTQVTVNLNLTQLYPGVCEPVTNVQSVAAGGPATAATYHQHTDTEEPPEGKGHSPAYRVGGRQCRGNTGAFLVHV